VLAAGIVQTKACKSREFPTILARSFDIPYGVSLKGPNYIVAGSGLEKLKDGTLLWTNTVTLTVLVPPIIHVLVDGVDRGSGSVQLTLTAGRTTKQETRMR
jgi:hypothetical protein